MMMKSYRCQVAGEEVNVDAESNLQAAYHAVKVVADGQEGTWDVKVYKDRPDGSALEFPLVRIAAKRILHYSYE